MGRRIIAVVGARPNYMKVAPIWRELDGRPDITKRLIHTGQHYDANMSKIFFDELGLPKPDVHLGVGSGPHGVQTGNIMGRLEPVLEEEAGDLLIVVGDVNSTMAGAVVAVKLGIPVAHVEAGLRSFDRTMPEEINRMITDSVAEFLFTTEPSAEANLLREGIDPSRIHFVGNVMIDSLMYYRPMADRSTIHEDLSLEPGDYGLLTLHRPSNVDEPTTLESILNAVAELGREHTVIFPAHPRTRNVLNKNRLDFDPHCLRIIDPIGYLDFVKLMAHSKLVLTDSGGIQEETTVLGIPCLTIRKNTERPVTIEVGTNRLVGTDPERILSEGRLALERGSRSPEVPEFWDGKAAKRIVRVFDEYLA